jgi:hypothetical protein
MSHLGTEVTINFSLPSLDPPTVSVPKVNIHHYSRVNLRRPQGSNRLTVAPSVLVASLVFVSWPFLRDRV